jgi:4-diphosphocytidyl-2-C-methyl-D-erythritol kinase
VSGAIWRVPAPAKLTLTLEITGVRPDGYHELRAEMVSLDLADELVIDPSGSGLRIHVGEGSRAASLPVGPDNLVARALAAVGRTARIDLHKRIPVGGGLGGGSSDAGAVLRWAGCSDPHVAASIGADVPFCVAGGRALVTGIGEQITPLAFEPRTFVLLIPPFGVDTAAVYRRWDQLSAERARPWHEPPNDLARAAIDVEARLEAWRALLAAMTQREPILAGSGSTWFVEGPSEQLGVEPGQGLVLGGERGILLSARSVPEAASTPVAVTGPDEVPPHRS